MFPEPKEITKRRVNPRRLLIATLPKMGKTDLVMQLEDNLVIDLEDSTDFYTGKAKTFNIIQNYEEFIKGRDNPPPLGIYVYKYFSVLVEKAKKEGPLYKYITIDTATVLEDVADDVSLNTYKKTIIGKSYKEDTIKELPHGAGWGRLRRTFGELIEMLSPVYSECLIILAHPKDSSITVGDKEITVQDLNLSGKLKQLITAKVDTMGIMYRKPKTNINILSFKTDPNNTFTGSRSPHLKNTEVEISELQEDGTLVANWDKIFIKE